jgi:hypothetical protein
MPAKYTEFVFAALQHAIHLALTPSIPGPPPGGRRQDLDAVLRRIECDAGRIAGGRRTARAWMAALWLTAAAAAALVLLPALLVLARDSDIVQVKPGAGAHALS